MCSLTLAFRIAAKVFFEKGFDGAATNEIAALAGLPIGSVYRYFKNKEAIVAALTTRYVSALRGLGGKALLALIGRP